MCRPIQPEYGRFYTYLKWCLRLKSGLVTVSVVDINSSSITVVFGVGSSNSKVYEKNVHVHAISAQIRRCIKGSACSINFVFTRVHVYRFPFREWRGGQVRGDDSLSPPPLLPSPQNNTTCIQCMHVKSTVPYLRCRRDQCLPSWREKYQTFLEGSSR